MAFDGHYNEWRLKRIAAVVEWFGAGWFRGKRILEVGAGYGDIGAAFWSLGAEVTFTEGREENVAHMKRHLPMIPSNMIFSMDAEQGIVLADSRISFDLILHLGLLYHLNNWKKSLFDSIGLAPYMVLESEVCDSDDSTVEFKVAEKASTYDQALHGTGTRPSAELVETVMESAGWHYQRLRDNRCNANLHTYDWSVTNSGACRNGQRRFWFCGKDKIRP